jgi:hypothetical protein
MKNILSLTAIIMFVLVGLSSCRKCEICTQESEPEIRVCQKDYDSATQYGYTIDGLEAIGYNCR